MRRTSTIMAISGAIPALAFGTACEPTPPPGKPGIVVEGPIWSFDTVVVRGTGCDPAHPAGPRADLARRNQQHHRAAGNGERRRPSVPTGPSPSPSRRRSSPPGAYVANLICTGSLTNVPTTPVNVIGGAAPHAGVSVTSPARPGGGATLTAWGCGRSANGEIQASISVLGPSSSFSFYGSTSPTAPSSRASASRPARREVPTPCGSTAASTRTRSPPPTCRWCEVQASAGSTVRRLRGQACDGQAGVGRRRRDGRSGPR